MKLFIQRLLAPFGYQIQSTNPENRLSIKDPEFLALYEKMRSHTLVQIDRCFMIYQAACATASLPGSVAELGVYKGGTAKIVGEVLKETGKRIYLFDSFSGMPWTEKDKEKHETLFEDVTLEKVKEYLKEYPAIEFRPDFFPDTAKGLEQEKFSLVYLDADLYESTKSGLEFFYPRMVTGGIILFDDYGSHNWTGVREAVDTFAKSIGTRAISTVPYQAMLIKQ
jgi:hypothetical protein